MLSASVGLIPVTPLHHYVPYVSLLHRAICDILLQFNVLRLSNNVLIHWRWLLLLPLLMVYCQGVNVLPITYM